MTLLKIWADDDPATPLVSTEDGQQIADELKQFGARFERWPVTDLPAEPTSDEVLAAYAPQVRKVIDTEGYILVDAMSMLPTVGKEKATQARQKFLSEHTHDDDEDRFFARGAGAFYLHVNDRVYAVLCEAGDLLSVPADTTHWFDMGTSPDFVAIRFFHEDDGWVGSFTGSGLAETFPDFDTLVASR
jgi:1,2-dihydroxy-3-keto-5-methylthiopentene dioxygenase